MKKIFFALAFALAFLPAIAQKTEIQFLSGLGLANYQRVLTNADNARGLYEHKFSVPKNWRRKRVFLVFDDARTNASASINGQSAGPLLPDGDGQFQCEVTSLVKFGAQNRLEVAGAKYFANASVSGAGRTNACGIFQPVYLEAVPQQFIQRVTIDAQADGNFSADIFLNGVTSADSVEAQIETLHGKKVGAVFSSYFSSLSNLEQAAHLLISPAVLFDAVHLQTKIASPKLGSSPTPNLYRVEIRLKQNGKTIHEISQRFSFRPVEVRDENQQTRLNQTTNGRKNWLK